MTVATPEIRYTPEDLLDLDSDLLYELVDGRLVEKKMSSIASETAGIVAGQLFIFLEKSHCGKLYPEQSFQCFPRYPGLIRRPDIAFVMAERLAGVAPEDHVRIAPDLAIEVVSPNDKVYMLDQKLAEYRDAGVKLIWVVNPNSRNIRVHRFDHTVSEFQETDTITGETVIPGFSILVGDLLPERTVTPTSPQQ